jgi:ferrous iron transport protein B
MCRRAVPSFLADGLIAGVGSVIVSCRRIMILFFSIILLEDFGYMARAAFLMDRLMGVAGLHGRAFIPLSVQLCLRHSGHHVRPCDRQQDATG